MVDIIDWPGNLRISSRSDPHLHHNTRSGGQALNGVEQVISPLTARWQWTISVPIHTKDGARSLRAIKTRVFGRYNYVRIRICDQYRISRKDVGSNSQTGSVSFSDDAYFSDDSGFALAQPAAEISETYQIGATEIAVPKTPFAGAMTSGVFFSINDWLYLITNWEENGDNYILEIQPPLREIVVPGDVADFDARAIWNFETDDEGTIDLNIGRFGTATISLVEAVGRSAP